MTDGRVYLSAAGSETKAFDLRDGSGIKLVQMAGIKVGFISGRPSEATNRRAKELDVDWVLQGIRDKGQCVRDLQRKEGYSPEEVCFVGDDLLDIPAMKAVGFPVAVADASGDVKAAARYVTRAKGGRGAVREVAELIVKTQGLWDNALERYWKTASSSRQ